MKKIFAVCLLLAFCVSLTACGGVGENLRDLGGLMGDAMQAQLDPSAMKTHTHEGVTMTLPAEYLDFTGTEVAGDCAFAYANETIGILGFTETKADLESLFGAQSAETYAALIVQLYALDAQPQQKDGLWHLTYEKEVDGQTLTCLSVFHETDTAIWQLQSTCPTEDYPQHADAMWSYLAGVTFE